MPSGPPFRLPLLLLVLLFLLASPTLSQIQEPTFRSFFTSAFDPSSSGSFTYSAWVSYFLSLDPSLDLSSPHLKSSFDYYDTNSDSTITYSQMLSLSITIPIKLGPKQLHLGYTGSSGEMQIMWVTQPDRYPSPIVKYGLSEHKLNMTAKATWSTYNAGKGGFWGRIYRAVMVGLEPGKKYHYKVGDHLLRMFSPVHTFVSPPKVGEKMDRIHFVAVGDMGTYAPMGHVVSNGIYNHHVKDPFNFVFLNGDIAYAGMSSEGVGEIEPIWDLFGQQVEKFAASVPFMPGVGNHEKYYNFSAYSNRYVLPKSQGSYENFWFSFDYGQLHLVHLSSEHPYGKGSQQYAFLENDLKRARGNNYTQWIMVAVHRPVYSSDKDSYSSSRPLAQALEDLFNEYQVDIVQTGHEHSYERMWPVYKGNPLFEGANRTHYVKPKTPIYVVQGTGGAMIRWRFVDPAPGWSAVRMDKWGFGNVEIRGGVLKYQFVDVEGKVVDEWRIVK